MNSRRDLSSLSESIDKGIQARTSNLLKMDLSNMTADAKEQFIRSVKDSILDSKSFRNEVAESIADMVIQKRRTKVWNFFKQCASGIGWGAGLFVAAAAVVEPVKKFLLSLLGGG